MSDKRPVTASERASSGNPQMARTKIFVCDYIVDCHIGVFEEEQGVTQKVGFSVEAAVGDSVGSDRDDIADVPSYDDLTDAVDATLEGGHINLVETMAERISERILKDSRFVWVRVRVEKLEREPRAVGIEIVRPRGCGVFV